ncbi:MAG: hypothetical protein JSR73_11865 [Proteobacteria bacterium]|nr:hypothetical protein [Pseudomonadota bacterium]
MVAVRFPVLAEPLVAFDPLQPPEAVHVVAFVELQLRVDAVPLASEVGFAVSVTVGAGTTVTVADCRPVVPPGPVHVRE